MSESGKRMQLVSIGRFRVPVAWRRPVVIGALFVAAATLSLTPVLSRAGWPANHEALRWKFRTLIYAFHLEQGDPFPIWSTDDFYGLGTPMPFFYHKLFYLFSGPLYLAIGSMKTSIVLVLAAFLAIGCVGLYRALRTAEVSPPIAALVAAALPFQSYTLFDWLVRGALAELSACMIVPWVLFSVLVVLREKRIPWHLFPNLLALALAHSVLAYLVGFVALAAIVVAFSGSPRGALAAQAKKTLLCLIVCCLVAFPWLVVFLRLENFDISVIASVFELKEQFASPFRSLLEGWIWSQPGPASPTLSPETQLFLLVTLAGIAWLLATRGWRLFHASPGLAFLLATLACTLVLQLPVSTPVYELIPGFGFIQFPWRLMGVTQVLALLVIGWGIGLIAHQGRGRVAIVLAAVFLALAAANGRGFGPVGYAWYPPAEVERVPAPGSERGAIGSGEYLPTIRLARESQKTRGLLRRKRYRAALPWLRETEASFASSKVRQRCQAAALPGRRNEALTLEYTTRCDLPATLIVGQSYSGLERVYVRSDGAWERREAYRLPEDPRIRLDLPAGALRIRVEVPRLWHAVTS